MFVPWSSPLRQHTGCTNLCLVEAVGAVHGLTSADTIKCRVSKDLSNIMQYRTVVF